MDEIERRKNTIAARRTDVERWSDPRQLEEAWEPRAAAAADFIPAGSAVLDIGCGAMRLERHLPHACRYVPCDLVARDPRTVVADLNGQGIPAAHVRDADVVTMLGVWEYLYRPAEVFAALSAAGRPIVCSYSVTDLSGRHDRRALGWVNDYSLAAFLALAAEHGYRPAVQRRFDDLQYLFKFVKASAERAAASKRVHVISYNNVGNFGDRLGFHVLNDVLPPHAEVTWGTLRPFTPVPEKPDLLVIGIGNSLFGQLLDDQLLQATAGARAAIGIFGTQYRESLPKENLSKLLDCLALWFARHEEDALIYGRGRSNVQLLGDWLINAFPMTVATDERTLSIDREILKDLPLDRTIQRIQSHKRVISERLHPLLCALTSAEEVAYKEQRAPGSNAVSGKFRSMFMDVFGRDMPEGVMWKIDRAAVADYKAHVRRNTDAMRAHIEALLR